MPLELVIAAMPCPSPSNTTTKWKNDAPTRLGLIGSATAVSAIPPPGSIASTMSGVACSMQPGSPCGSSAASGIAACANPYTDATMPIGGMPVAWARKVEPSHGNVVAVSWLVPPAPAHPLPYATAVAGHGDTIVPTLADGAPFDRLNMPPNSSVPSDSTSTVSTLTYAPVPVTPKPSADQPRAP